MKYTLIFILILAFGKRLIYVNGLEYPERTLTVFLFLQSEHSGPFE